MLIGKSKTASSQRWNPDEKARMKQIRMCKLATYNALIGKTRCDKDGSYRNQCKMSGCPWFQPTIRYKILCRSIRKRRNK